jgi:diguanylate cyclase (GGDEF)-like protein/PAS domain S-box-containing protein
MVQRALPALLGFVIIVVLGGVALLIGRTNLAAAEQDRLNDRRETVQTLAGNVADQASPDTDAPRVAATPFSPTATALNETLLKQFLISDDPAALVALVTADGRTIASNPPGQSVDVAAFSDNWKTALTGKNVTGDVIEARGTVSYPALVPVGGPQPWAVLVSLKPARGASQEFMEQIGSLNGRPGGLAVLDRKGVAYSAWSTGRNGQRVLTQPERDALPTGTATVWTRAIDGTEWTFVGTRVSEANALVFEQRTDDLFGDLRAAQGTRDLTLLAVLAAALVALVVFQLARERAARRAEAKVHALLKNSQDLVLVAGADGRLGFVSPAIEGLLGSTPEQWTGRSIIDGLHADDVDAVLGLLADPASGPLLNVRLRGDDGAHRYFDVEARDLRDHAEVGGILLTCHEIGDRKELQDELSHQATHDRLTGLPNRAELSARLERAMRNGRPVRPFALLYLDLDHFKPVNDTMGHDAGDEVLITVSHRLQQAAGPDSFVSRLGGDEFAVLLDGADEARAIDVARALREAAQAPVAVGARLANLDASIGIALAHPDIPLHNAEQLVRRADEAMYAAKHNGRGGWSVARTTVADSGETAGDAHIEHRERPATGDDRAATAVRPAERPLPPTVSTGGRRRRLSAALTVLVAGGLIAAIGGLGLFQASDAQRAAERDALQTELAFVGRAATFYSELGDTTLLVQAASNAPWTLDGSGIDAAVTKAFATAPSAGRDATAILATVDGQVLSSYPPGAPLGIRPTDRIWREAVQLGTGNELPVVEDPDQPRSYYVLPVRKDNQTVAVVALGLSNLHGPKQVALSQGAIEGQTTGGWSTIDGTGKVYLSWNPALVGTYLARPDQLTGLKPGESANLSTDHGVLVVSPMTSSIEPTYVAYAIPAADFYRNLRIGQTQRDLSFLAVVAAAVIGLAFVNHRREAAVRRSEARLDSLLQSAHDIVVVLDGEGRATFVSSAVQHLLGSTPEDLVGQRLIELIHREDHARVQAMLVEVHTRGAGSVTDVRAQGAAGEPHWFDLHAVDLRTHPEVRGVLLTCHEVTERRELQDQLAHRAVHDPLTGLPNRATLADELARLATTDPAAPFAVLFVDLDHFKPINDTLGHDAGDEVLRITARRFSQSVRVDGGDVVCRLGGDEFAIILRNTTEGVARATAERLIAAAGEPIELGADTVRVGASIGISLSHPDREHPDSAMRRADLAMYQAKEAGRGGYAVFPVADERSPASTR